MIRPLLSLTLFLGACTVTSEPVVATDADTIHAYDTPESALWNQAEDRYIVSNIAGESDAADGVGWLATVDADGVVLEPRWVAGLHAPKGMALLDGKLYVADLTELVQIDTSSGQILDRIAIPNALFLNDVTASPDTLWVSDTFGGAVFSFTPSTGRVAEVARDEALASLNGLAFDGTDILGGTTGDFLDPGDLGSFVRISPTTGAVTVLAESAGKIDGIVPYGAAFLATDFRGTLLSVGADGSTDVLMDLTVDHGLSSAADLGIDPIRNRVAIPDLFASTVVFIDLPR